MNRNTLMILLLAGLLVAGGLYYFKELRYDKVSNLPTEDDVIIKGKIIELEVEPWGGTVSISTPVAIDDGTGWAVILATPHPPEGTIVVVTGELSGWDESIYFPQRGGWKIITTIPATSQPVDAYEIHIAEWWE